MQQIIFSLFLCVYSLYGMNHLASQSSPYLQQHKKNPVDWYPWGEEAFTKAHKEHKLIFLSIGYSTCHWCHVMAREDFEDKEIATLLNKSFVSIKVDKEEYPQVDAYYQRVYQELRHKKGGWPLTFILTADKKPLFAGTYIPKYASYGSQGLQTILQNFSTLSQKKRETYADKIYKKQTKNKSLFTHTSPFSQKNMMQEILKEVTRYYDKKNSGFGTHPKFPHPSLLLTLLQIYAITHNEEVKNITETTLTTMAKSGLYDQIDGGFFRYCVDEKWQMPHFEKMLYTNAELIEVYAFAYTLTHNPLYKKVVQESIANIEAHLKEDGIYKSATNAESPNTQGTLEEGYYFLFKYEPTLHYLIKHHIKKEDAQQALKYFGIEEDGSFDGENANPHIQQTAKPPHLQTIRQLLQKMRKERIYPFIDYKRNTAWNALYISAKLATYSATTPYTKKEALASLDKLLTCNMKNGVLYHTSVHNTPLQTKAVLEDYAFVISALLKAYQLSLQHQYIDKATYLLLQAQKKFYRDHQWYMSDDSLDVVATMEDNSYKSALATLMQSALFLSSITNQPQLYTLVKECLDATTNKLLQHPTTYATALELYLQNHYGIYIIKTLKRNLLSLYTHNFHYPYVYLYATKNTRYELCGARSCFMITNKLNTLLEFLKTKYKTQK